jgi:hypothetical protein
MPEDPRGRNQQFDFASIEGHVRGYAEVLSKALLSVDWQRLNHVITELTVVERQGASATDNLFCQMCAQGLGERLTFEPVGVEEGIAAHFGNRG